MDERTMEATEPTLQIERLFACKGNGGTCPTVFTKSMFKPCENHLCPTKELARKIDDDAAREKFLQRDKVAKCPVQGCHAQFHFCPGTFAVRDGALVRTDACEGNRQCGGAPVCSTIRSRPYALSQHLNTVHDLSAGTGGSVVLTGNKLQSRVTDALLQMGEPSQTQVLPTGLPAETEAPSQTQVLPATEAQKVEAFARAALAKEDWGLRCACGKWLTNKDFTIPCTMGATCGVKDMISTSRTPKERRLLEMVEENAIALCLNCGKKYHRCPAELIPDRACRGNSGQHGLNFGFSLNNPNKPTYKSVNTHIARNHNGMTESAPQEGEGENEDDDATVTEGEEEEKTPAKKVPKFLHLAAPNSASTIISGNSTAFTPVTPKPRTSAPLLPTKLIATALHQAYVDCCDILDRTPNSEWGAEHRAREEMRDVCHFLLHAPDLLGMLTDEDLKTLSKPARREAYVTKVREWRKHDKPCAVGVESEEEYNYYLGSVGYVTLELRSQCLFLDPVATPYQSLLCRVASKLRALRMTTILTQGQIPKFIAEHNIRHVPRCEVDPEEFAADLKRVIERAPRRNICVIS